MNYNIDKNLVNSLLKKQFPEFENLEIIALDYSSVDNKIFRLGDEYLIRLPSAKKYSFQSEKEQKFLSKIADFVTIKVPELVRAGKKSDIYPSNFSIFKWIDGETAKNIQQENKEQFAFDLANILLEFQKINIENFPCSDQKNFYRGGDLNNYNQEFLYSLNHVKDLINYNNAQEIWNLALNSKFSHKNQFVHGDLSGDNILIKNEKLEAIIDFGLMCQGDPACDLVIYWKFFDKKSREIFKNRLNFNEETWNRARGWCLWKSVITLDKIKDKKPKEAKDEILLIRDILSMN